MVFAGRELVTTQSYVWSVLGEFTKDVVAFPESRRVMLISIAGGAWRKRMAFFSQFLLKEVVIEPNVKLECGSQVLLFGRHTWCRRRCGGRQQEPE